MTTELFWMTLAVGLTALLWIPYVLERIATRGLWGAVSGSGPDASLPVAPWAQRVSRAHDNAIENLAVFVPLVLTAHVLDVATPITSAAAIIYFYARLAYVVVYALGLPLVRTLAFAAGWGAQILFFFSILGWI
jgi:uncharacterized MAPEG superfamily protein